MKINDTEKHRSGVSGILMITCQMSRNEDNIGNSGELQVSCHRKENNNKNQGSRKAALWTAKRGSEAEILVEKKGVKAFFQGSSP